MNAWISLPEIRQELGTVVVQYLLIRNLRNDWVLPVDDSVLMKVSQSTTCLVKYSVDKEPRQLRP